MTVQVTPMAWVATCSRGVVDAVGTGVPAALVGLRVWVWEGTYSAPARHGGGVRGRPGTTSGDELGQGLAIAIQSRPQYP